MAETIAWKTEGKARKVAAKAIISYGHYYLPIVHGSPTGHSNVDGRDIVSFLSLSRYTPHTPPLSAIRYLGYWMRTGMAV